MAKMTKSGFRGLACILNRNNASEELVNDISNFLYSENPAFDEDRFKEAVKTGSTCRGR